MSDTEQFSERQGRVLLRVARQSILEHFGRSLPEDELAAMNREKNDPAFTRERATFVTLTVDGRLRGCIGNLVPVGTVLDGIAANARNAAFHDHRFQPVCEHEIAGITIETSILTKPSPLAFSSPAELCKALRPMIDGVILRSGGASSTFLPQVWEQLPQVEDFLGHLCHKAGLPPSAWKERDIEVETYQVQHFSER